MIFKNIHFIINPASGQDEPILSYINTAFKDTDINWEVFVTKQSEDATLFARQCMDKTDLIAVYGGDGSIAEVAKILMGGNIPMAIIPGGTANVISKEIGIPQDTVAALTLLASGEMECIEMDMGMLNDIPFMIRANFGIMADMVLEADRELKNKVGQLAYGITAIQTMLKSELQNYEMKIDGEVIFQEGVALTITNCGSIGIGNFSFLPEISILDGYLDVILLKEANLMSVLRVAGSTLMQKESSVLQHWKCKEIEINLSHAQKIILDDFEMEAQHFHIRVIPNVLKVIIPKQMIS